MKRNKGISLIVLVITIIVMIILAGSIIITLSNSGIINKANEAVDLSNDKQMQEYITSELILNGWYSGKPITEDLLKKIDGFNVTAAEVGGAWIIEKDGAKTTIYETGDIVKGETKLWTGEASAPEIKDGNWYIYTPEQLKFLAGYVNNLYEKDNGLTPTLSDEQMAQVPEITVDTTVYLMADLDLGARQENGTKTEGTEWIPIGPAKDTEEKQYIFRGTFEGNNHTIRGVYVSTDDKFAGIFGNSNTIQNLTIKDSYIKSKESQVGGIVGALRQGVLINCHNINTQVISELYSPGGVVGQFTGSKISNCSNTGTVKCNGKSSDKSNSQAGGVVGISYYTEIIENCANSGDISGEGSKVGGIIGSLSENTSIINCINTGNVIGKETETGGIVGRGVKSNNITNCTNLGDVLGYGNRVGGIVGDAEYTVITNCINEGEVTGKAMAIGGIVGSWIGDIKNCYNIGHIQSIEAKVEDVCIGGVAGITIVNKVSTIKNTYNVGKITVQGDNIKDIGGIVGYLGGGTASGTVSNSYNIGKIEIVGQPADEIGGIVGVCESSFTLNNNYYLKGTATTDSMNGNGVTEVSTSAEMKTEAFVKLLGETAWEIRAGENSGYPVLKGLK